MSEQKHTPGPEETWMTHGYSVYMNDGNGNTTWICDCKTKELAELIARAPELLQQVAELTKEKDEAQRDYVYYKLEYDSLRVFNDGLQGTINGLDFELSRLREREKELVEALRGIMESCDPENTSHETIWRIAYTVMSNNQPDEK